MTSRLKGLDSVEDKCPDRKDPKRIPGMAFGPSSSGKTTLLYRLAEKTGPVYTTWGGKRVDNIRFDGWTLDVFDFGGQERFRYQYVSYAKSHGARFILFVVDGTDKSNLAEAKDILDRLARQLPYCYFLIFINKTEEKGAFSTKKVKELLHFAALELPSSFTRVQRGSAETGAGVDEGLQWLVDQFKREAEEEQESKDKPVKSPYD